MFKLTVNSACPFPNLQRPIFYSNLSENPINEQDEPLIQTGWRASIAGIATATCFASSAIFIRYGLNELASPVIGVAIGMFVCTIAYALMLLIRGKTTATQWKIPPKVLCWQLSAGILVGLATWIRWVAMDQAPIAVVIALGRLSIPVVLILSPLLVGQKYEQVNRRVWLGASIIIIGSMILTFTD